jgi:Na+-driven multidrug efflux pump
VNNEETLLPISHIFNASFVVAPLSANSLAVQILINRTVSLLDLIMSSLGDAGSILIRHYISANKPMEAVNAKNVTYTLAVILILINISIILVSHQWLPYLFNITTDVLPLARYGLLLAA